QKAQEAKKSDAELQMMAEKIKMEIEPEAKKLEEDSARRSDELETKVNSAIRELATKGSYNLVLVKEAVLYGGVDLTNEVLKTITSASTATSAK
ncbi:MAG: OmpH family outer membrane protein, partial [Candidatus Caenarcaniphilales bacterium]|nr:OmpH family outer membrane protein [Candidatus Caenarcaniphilales bacterium]